MPKILHKFFIFALFLCIPFISHAAEDDELVKIGVLAKRGPEITYERWNETATYLSNEIDGYRFEILPLDFDEINLAVVANSIDFLIANSGIYVEMASNYGVHSIATMKTEQVNGDGYNTKFGSVIFYKKNRNDISKIADLKNKSVAAVEENSLGGWLMAKRKIIHFGVNPKKDLKSLDFLGTHDAVVFSVLEGDHDVGIVRTDTLEKMQAEGKININDFEIVSESKNNNPLIAKELESFPYLISTSLYPEWPIAGLPTTEDFLKENVASALLKMTPQDNAAVKSHLHGWTVPQDYQPVYQLLKELKAPPFDIEPQVTFKDFLQNYWIELTILSITGVLIILFSIRTRILSNKSKLEKEKAEKYFEIAEVMLLVLDEKGTIVKINNKGTEVLGYNKTELLGKNWFEKILLPEEVNKTKEIFSSLMSGSVTYSEVEKGNIVTKKGDKKVISWRNTLIHDLNGNIIGLLSSGIDITKKENKEESWLKQKEALEKINKKLIDRELKMAELKKELAEIKKEQINSVI